MKFSREIRSTGKIGTRPIEDRGKPEREMHKETSLAQASVCVNCTKEDCRGGERCYQREEAKHGK